jgi:hemerythrin-like metal-binding protein
MGVKVFAEMTDNQSGPTIMGGCRHFMSTPSTPFISWNDAYLLHHEAIDGQHQELVRLVGELYDAVTANVSAEARVERLTNLYNLSRAHFGTEEQLFRLHRYPRFLVHKAAHEGLAHALKGLREEVVSGERELTLEYVELIKLWLIDHFGEFDKTFGSFLSDKTSHDEKGGTLQASIEPNVAGP